VETVERKEYMKQYSKTYREKNHELIKEIAKEGDVMGAYKKLFPQVKRPYRSLQCRLEQYPSLRHELTKLLDVQGLNLIYANSKLKELLEAERPLVIRGKIHNVPDNPTQTENLKTLYKLHRVLNPEHTINVDNRKVEFNISDAGVKQLEIIAEELNRLTSQVDLTKHKILPKDNPDIIDAQSTT
jgi:hypothetical protein